jgi:flagellar basal body-associated protein FliL
VSNKLNEGEQMNKKQKIKVILLTSIVWVIVIAGAIAVVKYGEYQRTQGMLDGFTKAKEILIQK